MIYYFLYIEVKFRPEVVERILRVIRHRGFVLYALNMLPCSHLTNNTLHIYITLMSKRSIDVLCEHLNKLIDVSCVVVQGATKNYNRIN
ncbi:acetolactate synthase 2 small subunit [Blochmannia endosymbiont of Polyrhachis (Hedomyrma) turneri]|uniref:acetolactate synthase 2 small subunit n=1 Tax=Blochmannia endosymbiont of Polyrhachis (Hedomyrma) turneri TaxID=1505596 RepID=UPI00061B165E